jgi:hypothetical protein
VRPHPVSLRRSRSALLAGTVILALSGCSLPGVTGAEEPVRDPSGMVTATSEAADVFSIRVGDCLDDGRSATEVDTVPTVPCTGPHDSEVYASVELSDGDYPGQDAIFARADEQCLVEFEVFLGESWTVSPYDFSYYHPTEKSWNDGDREILCVIYDPAGPVTGSLAGAAAGAGG